MRNPPVWENSLRIAKFRGPRISLSEGRECVENTGLTGKIAFSPHELGTPGGTRTPNIQNRNLTLYPLNYGRMSSLGSIAGSCAFVKRKSKNFGMDIVKHRMQKAPAPVFHTSSTKKQPLPICDPAHLLKRAHTSKDRISMEVLVPGWNAPAP